MKDEWIEIHKELAGRALYNFYRNRFASIEVAVESVVGEAVPEVPEGTTFREIMIARTSLISEVLKWTRNPQIQKQAKKDVQEYNTYASRKSQHQEGK